MSVIIKLLSDNNIKIANKKTNSENIFKKDNINDFTTVLISPIKFLTS